MIENWISKQDIRHDKKKNTIEWEIMVTPNNKDRK